MTVGTASACQQFCRQRQSCQRIAARQRHHAGVEGWQQGAEGVAIVGQRRHHEGITRAGDQRGLAVGAQPQQVANRVLGTLQSRRLNILSKHGG